MRRCIVCIQLGRRGGKANAVTNVAAGTCDEHVNGLVRPDKISYVPTPATRIAVSAVRRHVAIVDSKPPVRAKVVEETLEQETVPEISEAESSVFEKRRRGSAEKIAALEEVSAELRKNKTHLQVFELMEATAKKLRMTSNGLRAFWCRLPKKDAHRLLYGEGGHKITSKEIKFGILVQLREEMRKAGKPAPMKREFAALAAEKLGMKVSSAEVFVYEKLTKEQKDVLEFAPPPRETALKLEDQVAILKRIRQEMRAKGLPAPRQSDLAAAAAPILKQEESSVRTLIVKLPKEIKEELDFMQSHSRMLVGLDPATIREGFIGAIAVLKLRRLPVTASNLQLVLRLEPAVIGKYLGDNPDVQKFLDTIKI